MAPNSEPLIESGDGDGSVDVGAEDGGAGSGENIENLLPRVTVIVLPHTNQRNGGLGLLIQPRLLIGTAVVRDFDHVVRAANGTRGKQTLLRLGGEIPEKQGTRNPAAADLPHHAGIIAG